MALPKVVSNYCMNPPWISRYLSSSCFFSRWHTITRGSLPADQQLKEAPRDRESVPGNRRTHGRWGKTDCGLINWSLLIIAERKVLAELVGGMVWFTPTEDELHRYGDGGVAIVDQWIASHAKFFVGRQVLCTVVAHLWPPVIRFPWLYGPHFTLFIGFLMCIKWKYKSFP